MPQQSMTYYQNPYDIQFVEENNLICKKVIEEEVWEKIIQERILTTFIQQKREEKAEILEEDRRYYIETAKAIREQAEVQARENRATLPKENNEHATLTAMIIDMCQRLLQFELLFLGLQKLQHTLHMDWDNLHKRHVDSVMQKLASGALVLVDANGAPIPMTENKMAAIQAALKPTPIGTICKVNPTLSEALLAAANRQATQPNLVAENMFRRAPVMAELLALSAAADVTGPALARVAQKNRAALRKARLNTVSDMGLVTKIIEDDVGVAKHMNQIEQQMRDAHDSITALDVARMRLVPSQSSAKKLEDEPSFTHVRPRKPLDTLLRK